MSEDVQQPRSIQDDRTAGACTRLLRPALRILLCLALTGIPPSQAAAQIRYSTTAALPVVEYTELHSLLAENDPVPLLRIYGDGRVSVHRPAYMKAAGDFALQLTPAELDTLLQSLAADGIVDFDLNAAREERRQLDAGQRTATGLYYAVSDTTQTRITVRLDAFRRGPAAPPVTGLHTQFRWDNLDFDTRRFPQSGRLQGAQTAARRLQALTRHPALVRTP